MAKRKARSKAQLPPGVDQCVRTGVDGKAARCKNAALHFVMGQHLCDAHNPTGDASCTHSLGIDRCAWCGADLRG